MSNKTVVFDVQKEIADLKRRVQQLENEKTTYWPTYQSPNVPGYPSQLPIFGPQPTRVYESPWSEDYKGPNGFFNDPNRPFP